MSDCGRSTTTTETCGSMILPKLVFMIIGTETSFASARHCDTEETILRLDA